MESEDYPFFQGLVFLLENDVSSLGYELTFSTEVLIFSLIIFFDCNFHFIYTSIHSFINYKTSLRIVHRKWLLLQNSWQPDVIKKI